MPAPDITRPQPGFYRTRFVKNGPWIAARIWLDDSIPERPAVLLAEVDGKEADPYRIWPSVIGNDITEIDFRHLGNVRRWAQTSAPHAPEAQPFKPINLSQQPAFTPRRTA